MDKKVAVVTGGSKGIGLAIVKKFLSEGFTVYSSSRTENKEIENTNLKFIQADLSIKADVQKFTQQITREVEKVDVLVNNVGVFIPGALMEEDDGIFEVQVNTNLASTYHTTRGLIARIKKSDNPYIFSICSTASITPYMNGGSYCISKYAQLGFTKVLREELKSDKIRVSAVLPGATLTNSWAGTDLPTEKFIDPASVAQLIWDAYQLPQNTVVEELLVRPMDGDIT